MKKLALIFVLAVVVISFYFLYFQKKPFLTQTPTNTTGMEESIEKTNPKIGNPPTVNIDVPDGYAIGVFADKLSKARDLEFAPNGTLLVSITDNGQILALPDKNNDGIADQTIKLLSNLRKPHGLTFHNGMLYVASELDVSRYTYDTATDNAFFDKKLFDLPFGGRHYTRSIVFDDNNNLYVSLGSRCDTCVEDHPYISTVLISNSDGVGLRVYSKGLRNAVFLAKDPATGQIFATEMGRDFLGDNLPPDEINILQDGADYGWPYCYGDKVWDKVFGRQSPAYCEGTIEPFFNLPAHVAPLGLTFIQSSQFPNAWQNDLLVALHGSWNSTSPVGYKVIRISKDGRSSEDFITGFERNSHRVADVIFDREGSLFISDDEYGAIYKVIKTQLAN